MEWLAEPETQVKWYAVVDGPPSVESAWQDQTLQGDKKLAVFGEQLKTAKAPPPFPTWEQVIAGVRQRDGEDHQDRRRTRPPALKTVQQQAQSTGTGM